MGLPEFRQDTDKIITVAEPVEATHFSHFGNLNDHGKIKYVTGSKGLTEFGGLKTCECCRTKRKKRIHVQISYGQRQNLYDGGLYEPHNLREPGRDFSCLNAFKKQPCRAEL